MPNLRKRIEALEKALLPKQDEVIVISLDQLNAAQAGATDHHANGRQVIILSLPDIPKDTRPPEVLDPRYQLQGLERRSYTEL